MCLRSTLRLLTTSLVAAGLSCASLSAASAAKPNIIFILADDLGYGDLGCFGQEQIETPRLDQLATEGMRFTDAYAGSTVCAPSRSVLMTGQHVGHTTVRGNAGRDRPAAAQSLVDADVTVAEVLDGAGYVTAMIGKWGLGDPLEDDALVGLPTRQGFDYAFGYMNQRHAHNYYPTHLWRNETRVNLRNVVPDEHSSGAGVATEKIDYSGDIIQRDVLDFIRTQHKRPFFLYYPTTLPHANNESKPLGLEVPGVLQYADKDWPEAMKQYAAMVTTLDTYVGEVVDLIEELGLTKDTLIIFSSDNGPHRESGGDPEFFHSSGPFRGIKRSLTEGGIRVPTIARWPNHVPAGKVSRTPWYFADVLPTLAEIAGVKVPAEIDGISIVPTLLGRAQPVLENRFMFWEFYERTYKQAARRGKWKAIRSGMDIPLELYDLQSDPGEEFNVASKHREITAQFQAWLETARTDNRWWKIPGPKME